jgi:hypothetical protein
MDSNPGSSERAQSIIKRGQKVQHKETMAFPGVALTARSVFALVCVYLMIFQKVVQCRATDLKEFGGLADVITT